MLGQFGITGDAANTYADKLGLIPGNVNTSVNLTDNASAKLLTIQEMLDSIPAYKQITVNATMRQSGVGDIDHDPSTPYAYGGYTGPGGKWDVAGVVHRGEWVFDQEKTQRYWSLFNYIQRGGRIPGYADGGFVSGDRVQYVASNSYGSAGGSSYDHSINVRVEGNTVQDARALASEIVRRQRQAIALSGIGRVGIA
jgi:hypothetical protein